MTSLSLEPVTVAEPSDCSETGASAPTCHQTRAPASPTKHPRIDTNQEFQRLHSASSVAGSNPDTPAKAAWMRLREQSTAAHNRRVYPDPAPIGFKYTVYYPGNMDLIITAGHNGLNLPGNVLSPPMTHVFRPCLRNSNDAGGRGEGELESYNCFMVPLGDEPLEPAGATAAPRTQAGDQQQQQQQQQQHQSTLITRSDPSSSMSPRLQQIEKQPSRPPTTMPDVPMRDRDLGGNLKADLNTTTMTIELATSISDILSGDSSPIVVPNSPQPQPQPQPQQRSRGTRLRPHVVLFRLHRKYVDVNRNIYNADENAAPENSPDSAAAWHEYHGVIDHVRALIETRKKTNTNVLGTQRGLLLDIHDGAKLSQEDAALDAAARELALTMSIRSLIERWQYTIQRHGSRDGGTIDAIQLEVPRSLRFGTRDEMREITQRMGWAIVEYLYTYYDVEADSRATALEENLSSIAELSKSVAPSSPVSPRKAMLTRPSKKQQQQQQQQQQQLYQSHSALSLTSSENGGVDESGDECDSKGSRIQPPSDNADQSSSRPALLRKSSRL
ncbi:hypothetical protein DFQ26_007230 [Actinomortierella ambigua]|nr:hypothetical protein DFQ26_007230 [Actinomortierella ambigua]